MKGQYIKIVVAASLIMCTMIAGTVSFGFFMEPVTSDLGLERGKFSVYFSLISIVGAITLPFYGRMISRFGTRPLVIACGLWTGVAMAALSQCHSLISFYVVGCLVGLGFFGCSYAVVPVIVSCWFVDKQGFVMGVASTCGGVSGIVASMVFPSIIGALGWQVGYVCMGVMVVLFTVPAGVFLLRSKPEDIGLEALGARNVDQSEKPSEESAQEGVMLSQALKMPGFWACMVAFFLFSMTAMITQHLPAHIVGLGYSSVMAGLAMSVMSAGILLTSMLAGPITDRLGPAKSVAIFIVFYAAAFIALPSLKAFVLICVCLVLLSICNVNMTIFAPLVTSAAFGPKDYASIWGLASMANVAGQAVGAPLYGLVFDAMGSYSMAMYGAAVAAIIACALVILALKAVRK